MSSQSVYLTTFFLGRLLLISYWESQTVYQRTNRLFRIWNPQPVVSKLNSVGLSGSVGCASNWWSGGCGFDTPWVLQHSFIKTDHGIFSTVVLPLPLIPLFKRPMQHSSSIATAARTEIWQCHKEDKAHPRTNLEDLASPMLHCRYQDSASKLSWFWRRRI